MPRAARRDSLLRRKPRFTPRKRLLIVCEGKVTEPEYINGVRRDHNNRLVSIEVVPEGGVPKSIVEYAKDRKREAERQARKYGDQFLKFDEVWCVFDVDTHPNLEAAKNQARDNGILTAISNPCFELWLLLHFQDQFAEQERHVIQRACQEHLPDYDKHVPYDRLRGRLDDAVRRATQLERWQENRFNVGANPSTGVYKLVQRIRELGKESFLIQASGPR